MARRGNFGFEKRQKEIKRKQKADAKMERRRAAREAANQPDSPESPGSDDAGAPALPESESESRDPELATG